MIWIAQESAPPAPIDTVIFDVDGVLWETGESYDRCVALTVDHLLRQRYGMAHPRPVSDEELRLFRRAGGLNNDWHMTYVLVALRLLGREDLAQAAAESQGQGMAWAESLLHRQRGPAIEYDEVVRLFNEYYWGSQDFARHFGEPPRYVQDAPGCWHHEKQLIPQDLIGQLRGLGVHHFGIATGRDWRELDTVLAASQLDRQIPRRTMLTSDLLSKPDGRVLDWVLGAMSQAAQEQGEAPPRAALFCGDTRDDLDAVLNYRQLRGDAAHWVGAVAVAPAHEHPFFGRNGSDAALEHIQDLPRLITQLGGRRGDG